MISALAQALVPVCFCVLVGLLAAKLRIFDRERIRPISIYVVTLALPAALFVGTFKFSVHDFAQWRNLVVLFIAMSTTWIAAFLLGRTVLGLTSAESAILGLNASYPDMAYLGIPVLTTLFSATGLLPAILGNIVSSFVLIPLTVAFLHRHDPGKGAGTSTLLQDLRHTVLQPLIWAPMLAIVLVILGVGLPALVASSVGLIGQSASGVALTALGVLLFGLSFRLDRQVGTVFVLKNLVQPALAALLVVFFGLHGPVAEGLVVVLACPCATASAMFASSYRIGEISTAAAVLVSTISSLLTLSIWILFSKLLFES